MESKQALIQRRDSYLRKAQEAEEAGSTTASPDARDMWQAIAKSWRDLAAELTREAERKTI